MLTLVNAAHWKGVDAFEGDLRNHRFDAHGCINAPASPAFTAATKHVLDTYAAWLAAKAELARICLEEAQVSVTREPARTLRAITGRRVETGLTE